MRDREKYRANLVLYLLETVQTFLLSKDSQHEQQFVFAQILRK